MHDLFGLEISEGALANLLDDSSPAFADQTRRIKQRLLSGTALASDETSVRVGKTTFWTWVFHHGDSACFVIHPSRAKAVVAEFLGDFRLEIWISDRLAAQMGWATTDHQVCLAHLLRDIQHAIDAGDAAFAPGLKTLIKRAVCIGHRRPSLADTTLVTYHSRLPTPGSRPSSTNCSRSCPRPGRAGNFSASSSGFAKTCSSSSPTVTSHQPIMAPSRH
jgi:transposase